MQVQRVCTYKWRRVLLLADHRLFLWRQVPLQTHTRPTGPRQETMTTLTMSPTLPTPASRHIKEGFTKKKKDSEQSGRDGKMICLRTLTTECVRVRYGVYVIVKVRRCDADVIRNFTASTEQRTNSCDTASLLM